MRIAIAHHDPAFGEALRALVAADARLALAWSARTAADAIAQALRDRPDLLLLELGLPGLDAAEVTTRVMRASPCAILVVCDEAHAAASRAPYAALAAGALDAVTDTGFVADPARSPLATKLAQLVRIVGAASVAPAPAPVAARRASTGLLAIGASTGGPAVIAKLLRELPAPLPLPCIVVQHIDPEFAPGMAAWLQTETGHAAVLATGGETPRAGTVYLGGGAGHLVLADNGRLAYRREPADSPYQPSIDEFFLSARAWPAPALAVLLTGMGRDGARGLAALRGAGWVTVAQSPASCAVQGMPQAAIDLGAAQHVLDPDGISALLRDILRKVSP